MRAVACLLLVHGCSLDFASLRAVDGGRDGGGRDGGGSDAARDGGGPVDAGADAGADAGLDGAAFDAGAPDGAAADGGAPDGGAPDSGVPDAGADADPCIPAAGGEDCGNGVDDDCDLDVDCADDGCPNGTLCTGSGRCCGGTCLSSLLDPRHCGGCALSCDVDRACVSGGGAPRCSCTASIECPMGQQCMGGLCACKSDEHCANMQTCVSGRCRYP